MCQNKGEQSKGLLELALQILTWAEYNVASLTAIHLKWLQNLLKDLLSRRVESEPGGILDGQVWEDETVEPDAGPSMKLPFARCPPSNLYPWCSENSRKNPLFNPNLPLLAKNTGWGCY